MSSFATLSITDRIATLTLDDGKANAFGFAMMEAINTCLDEAEANADVIVLKGRPSIMCAGFDLKVMNNSPDDATQMVRLGGELLLRLFSCAKPVVISTSGHGIAAGGLLMLAADYRIGTQGEARYGLNESAIGMVLPPFGMDMARFKLNNQYLDASVVGAELYLPDAAVRVGYLDEVVAPENLDARTLEKAQALLELDGKAFAGNKKIIRGAAIEKIRAELETGAGLQVGV
jgi:enoyl-CoA hydratase